MNTLMDVFCSDYKPLGSAAIMRILDFDQKHGPDHNRNRFYLYLIQKGEDVQVRTVAVKAPKRGEDPRVKEVAHASVDDAEIHVRDLAYHGMAGYVVDWTPEGFGPKRQWTYDGQWEAEKYALRCMWKLHAPVINPELLKQTERFRYSCWEGSGAHILDYMKIFAESPGIEHLSKNGLGHYSTKVMLIRKLKKDQSFRQWFGQHAPAIRKEDPTVPAIMRAYRLKHSIRRAQRELDIERIWREYRLPKDINCLRAEKYVNAHRTIMRYDYGHYIGLCGQLGLDLSDTKIAYPKQLKRRRRALQDQIEAMRRQKQRAERAAMTKKLATIADEWGWLEQASRAFLVVIPRTEKELKDEGKAMENCIGTYAGRISRGESVVIFVRRASAPKKAFIDVEYDPETFQVKQCYGANNSKPSKAVENFVNRIIKSKSREKAA